MKSLRFNLLLVILGAIISQTFAQESLQEKYNSMLESTETYEQYKVIPRTTINGFWSEVSDSLGQNTRTIQDLRSQILTQKATIESLEGNTADLQSRLDQSLNVNDSINFMGVSFSKVGYHLMVWLIILILAVLGVISYLMFMRSNRVTSRTKKDYDLLNAEFEEQKTKAREAQVKLKRELQTAVNQLNERR